jgi:hypothetical protein
MSTSGVNSNCTDSNNISAISIIFIIIIITIAITIINNKAD